MAFYWGTTVVAIGIGFFVGGVLLPFGAMTPEQQTALRATATMDTSALESAAAQLPGGIQFLVGLVPSNPVRALVDGALLPVVVFVTIFAIAAAGLPAPQRELLTGFSDAASQALIKIVHWVLRLAPIGIFALVMPTVAQFGWSLVQAMLWFVAAVAAGCLLFIGIVYVPLVFAFTRLRPGRFLHDALPAMLMAFSTTSSLAALPTMLESAGRTLKISPGIAGFTLPVGASMNRGGSALYQAVALLFVAQLYGTPLGAGSLLQAGTAVFLASLTVAAVPSGSVVSLLPAFTATGLPLQGLPLLIGLDRVPDMFRTMTNVTGDMAAASVIAGIEGEQVGG
jgi:Na+/H+-dicarboxylate symporter